MDHPLYLRAGSVVYEWKRTLRLNGELTSEDELVELIYLALLREKFVEIKIGDKVTFSGKEFVVTDTVMTQNSIGEILTITAYDPELANQVQPI